MADVSVFQSVLTALQEILTQLQSQLEVTGEITLDDTTISALQNVEAQITNFPTTQEISATSLPLPAGAATEAKQATANSSLDAIDDSASSINQLIADAVITLRNLLNSSPISDSSGRCRVIFDNTVVLPSVTTVSSIS